jgi:hypothetical protein
MQCLSAFECENSRIFKKKNTVIYIRVEDFLGSFIRSKSALKECEFRTLAVLKPYSKTISRGCDDLSMLYRGFIGLQDYMIKKTTFKV